MPDLFRRGLRGDHSRATGLGAGGFGLGCGRPSRVRQTSRPALPGRCMKRPDRNRRRSATSPSARRRADAPRAALFRARLRVVARLRARRRASAALDPLWPNSATTAQRKARSRTEQRWNQRVTSDRIIRAAVSGGTSPVSTSRSASESRGVASHAARRAVVSPVLRSIIRACATAREVLSCTTIQIPGMAARTAEMTSGCPACTTGIRPESMTACKLGRSMT